VVVLLPRTSFNSSQLVRVLGGLDVDGAGASRSTLAEDLGSWLPWTDAIALAAVLQAGAEAAAVRPAPVRRAAREAPREALRGEALRLRVELSRAIVAEARTVATATSDEAATVDTGFRRWRASTGTLQRAMDTRVAALRGRVRALLAAGAPALQRLAALDAVLDSGLRTRERQLLGTVQGVLERHGRRRPGAAGDGAQAWQQVMLAELDLRLQPVEGLLDALDEAHAGAT